MEKPGERSEKVWTQADLLEKYKTFNEIMTGPNPLTKEEIRKLVEKRPEQYAWLRAWLDR